MLRTPTLRKNLVALLHFVHDPAQREDDFLRIGHDRNDEMRQRVVLLQLDHLRIDHHEPELVGRKAIEQRRDDRIDANGFAGAGAAGDQQVRHFREVGDDRMAVNIFAQRERDLRFGVAPFLGFQQVAHDDLGFDGVRHFDADGAFSGHWRENVDALGFERGGDVVVQRRRFFPASRRARDAIRSA